MAKKHQSGRFNNLAARQHNDSVFQEGQFDDATESTGQVTLFGGNNNTRTPRRTTRPTVVSPPNRKVILGRGGFTNSPGNKAATDYICGTHSEYYKNLPTKEKKRFAQDVYVAMIKDGFTFVVKTPDGSKPTDEQTHALKYIQRKLREGEVTAEERRQKCAKHKDNHPNLVAFKPIVEEEDTFRQSGSHCPRSHR